MSFNGVGEFDETIYIVQWRIERTRGNKVFIYLDRIVVSESMLAGWIDNLKRRGVEYCILTYEQTNRSHCDGTRPGKKKRK